MNPPLLLIPTPVELQWAGPSVEQLMRGVRVELCGFGPVVAGSRTMQLIERYRPSGVWLVGIAGAYTSELDLGAAYEFSQVGLYGVGVGSGCEHQTLGELGWEQWSAAEGEEASSAIGDLLTGGGADASQRPPQIGSLQIGPLPEQRVGDPAAAGRYLLTVCAAAAGPDDVARRLEKYPQALAEDMEGFAVAAACHLAGVPWRIVRGISNRAGDRDHRRWQAREAMRAAVSLARAGLPAPLSSEGD